jgi:hypothetical protein
LLYDLEFPLAAAGPKAKTDSKVAEVKREKVHLTRTMTTDQLSGNNNNMKVLKEDIPI